MLMARREEQAETVQDKVVKLPGLLIGIILALILYRG